MWLLINQLLNQLSITQFAYLLIDYPFDYHIEN